jgi:hypothetical protein
LVAALLGLACASERILVASELDGAADEGGPEDAAEGGADAAAPSDAGAPDAEPADASEGAPDCQRNADCEPSWFCARSRCADASGRCEPRPNACDSQPAPVCGCDGITYFNDCLRRARGVGLRAWGECGREAMGCDGLLFTCPPDAHCGRLITVDSFECPPVPFGKCWMLPFECDPRLRGGDRYIACDRPPMPGDGCVDLCQAVRRQTPHLRVFRCPW